MNLESSTISALIAFLPSCLAVRLRTIGVVRQLRWPPVRCYPRETPSSCIHLSPIGGIAETLTDALAFPPLQPLPSSPMLTTPLTSSEIAALH